MNPHLDFYFKKQSIWKEEIIALRSIVLNCNLKEELKWGCPCYTFENKNIVLIHVFKDYCAVLFFKGALLKDSKNLLIQQTANVQAARQLRFTNIKEVIKHEKALKAFVFEAIVAEEKGLKVEFKKTKEFTIPEEFQNTLHKNSSLKTAFYKLTPGRQRAYLLYFSSAKQIKTRESRIKKHIPNIMNGKGLDD